MATTGTSPSSSTRATHTRDGVALACAGVAGWGVAPLVDQPGWAWPVLAGGVLGGAAVMSSGHRRTHRAQLLERANDAVAPLLGVTAAQARGRLRTDRWTQGWPGSPRRVRVRYGTGKVKLLEAAVEVGDRRWAGEVASIVGARFGAEYRVETNDPGRGKLCLRLHEPRRGAMEKVETAPVARARRIVDELLGGTATVTDLVVDDAGMVKRLAVEHEIGAKLANIGYRRRIERSVSVLLPGRWRAHWDMEADAVTFEVRPTLPESIWIPPLSQPEEDPLTNYRAVEVPYGVDEDGEVMTWRPAVTPQWLITGGTGSGKLEPLTSLIPTPDGFKTMGDLEVGDQVFGRDGELCRVVRLWPVQQTPRLFRVTFSDGQSIECDHDHQWLVSTFQARQAARSANRRRAIESHAAWWKRIGHLEELAQAATAGDVSLSELLSYLSARVEGLPWTTQLGIRAALDMVECPFRLQQQLIPQTTGGFGRPVRQYDLPTAVKALSMRLTEQHHTPPAGVVDELRMTTAEMLSTGLSDPGGQANFAVRVAAALQLPQVDLAVAPYVLGAWLGDGTRGSGQFTQSDSPSDPPAVADTAHLIAELTEAGFAARAIGSDQKSVATTGLHARLHALGVLHDKHIPPTYLRASAEQRLALLQGLMDTVGTVVGPSGCCELSLSGQRLASDAVALIRSLGIKASVSWDQPGSDRDASEVVTCQDGQRIHFTTTAPVFRLPCKLNRLPKRARETQRWLYVTSIQPIASAPGRCITVDSPDHTYLTGIGYVPTSNTSTTHGILARITQYGWPVWIADGKGVEFLGFRDWPNIQVVASRIEQQVAVIRRAWELMEYRYQLVVDGRARTEDFEPLIVFVDEFTDLKHNLLAWYSTIKVKGDPTKPPTLGEVGSIARKGRTSRVHLVLAMQRPDTEFFGGGEARDNFGQRTSMGPLSPDGAQMMWNNPVTGVALPRGRIGRAVGVNAAGVPVEMQCYRVPDPKDALPGTAEHELLMQLRPAESHQERLVIVPPSIDWTGDDPIEPTFSDFARAEWLRAEDRPDLDPLANQHPSVGGDGRALSSPMALLGLTGIPAPAGPDSKRGESAQGRSPGDGRSPGRQLENLDQDDLGGVGDGYGSRVAISPTSLRPGDLVCVDEDADEWAVVEEEPMADYDDDDAVVVAWRDDQDNSGQLIVAAEAQLAVRRPLEVV